VFIPEARATLGKIPKIKIKKSVFDNFVFDANFITRAKVMAKWQAAQLNMPSSPQRAQK